jgi:methylmalonyl-CoA mutase cobalamin-binding domain/chain
MSLDLVVELQTAVLGGEAEQSRKLTERLLGDAVSPEQLLDEALIPAMSEAGQRFETQEFFLPDLLLAARAMKEALGLLRPLLADRDFEPAGRVVIGTVAGDLHDIGKNIVAAMLEGGGFHVLDLGYDVAPNTFADAVREHEPDIVALSALLTTSVPVMQTIVTELQREGLRDRVRVLAGGAPLTEAGAAALGADAYAPTGPGAVQVALQLLAGELDPPSPPPVERSACDPRSSTSIRGQTPSLIREHPRQKSHDRTRPDATSRELVKQAITFKSPARLPRQLWLLPWASKHYPEEVALIEQEFPSDIVTIPVFCSEPVPGQGNAHTVGTFVDAWGCEFENLQDGIIGEVKRPQIADWANTGHVRFPRERLAIDTDQISAFCRETNKYVIAGTCPRPFERLQFLRGTENLYLDLGRPPTAFRDFLTRLHEFYIEELTLWAQTDVDALMFMDDWGSQQALLISPQLWRELFKPLYAEYVDIAHSHGKHAFMHSDGYTTDIIPDLIEIGVDVLNSQVFCMNVEKLGASFGGELCFWGEMDRQQLLPHATKEEIASAARRLVTAFHRDGGFIAMCEFGPGARPANVREFFAVCAEV